ncbi:MAG: 50S ribosomal protein L22 [Acidobacteriota bacterium]|nr:MAG: 50S ribosomal protein L22 [Acidobacteriota bacterium]
MEVRAILRNVRISPRRGRQVADLVRRRSCGEALTVLQGSPRRAARALEKLIRSALANAEERNARSDAGIDLDNLYIKTVTVDEGTRMWRTRPRAYGRAAWINKGMSHITVVLDER